jgi:hypothetical protein
MNVALTQGRDVFLVARRGPGKSLCGRIRGRAMMQPHGALRNGKFAMRLNRLPLVIPVALLGVAASVATAQALQEEIGAATSCLWPHGPLQALTR